MLPRLQLSKRNFSADNLDNISTDPHINHSVIPEGGADKNLAGTSHLDSLLDQHAFFGLSDTVGCHPCRRASRCTPRSRSTDGSRGRTNVVMERFISPASA
jgi:hypothetical protein